MTIVVDRMNPSQTTDDDANQLRQIEEILRPLVDDFSLKAIALTGTDLTPIMMLAIRHTIQNMIETGLLEKYAIEKLSSWEAHN